MGSSLNVQTARGDSLLHAAAPTDNIELIYWLLGKGLNPGKKNLFGQYPKDVARSKVVRDLLPIDNDLPQFDLYSGEGFEKLEDKVLLRVPSSMKVSTTNSKRTKGSKISKRISGSNGESQYDSQYGSQYDSQYESNYKDTEGYGEYEEDGIDEEEEDEDEEDNENEEDDEEYEEGEGESGFGVSQANSQQRSNPSKSEIASYQGVSLIPSRAASNRSYGQDAKRGTKAGGVSRNRTLTPSRQPTQGRKNNLMKGQTYGGEQRSVTPGSERLPMIRKNNTRYNAREGSSFGDEGSMGRRSSKGQGQGQGQSSYLNYLEEISNRGEKEDLSRDYKLPMIPKKGEHVPR